MSLFSRFIKDKRQFGTNPPSVKYTAFIPNSSPDPETGKQILAKSVFNIDELEATEIWEIADEHVSDKISGRMVRARGDINELSINDIGLKVDQNNIPPRHANILGWDETDPDRNKLYAKDLALAATLVIR